jgi:hypothetical protein
MTRRGNEIDRDELVQLLLARARSANFDPGARVDAIRLLLREASRREAEARETRIKQSLGLGVL